MKEPEVTTRDDIHPFDVLMGRGKSVHNHSGNIAYRREVKERSHAYVEETGLKRDAIAGEVIRWVWSKGGRFLRRMDDNDMSHWEECPNSMARAKVKQALRDFVKEKSKEKRSDSESECVDTPFGLEILDICSATMKEGITNHSNGDLQASGLHCSRAFEPSIPFLPSGNPATLLHTETESHHLPTAEFSDIHRYQIPLLMNPPLDYNYIQRTVTLPWWEQRSWSAVPEPQLFPLHHSDDPPLGGVVWLENVLRTMGQQGEEHSGVTEQDMKNTSPLPFTS